MTIVKLVTLLSYYLKIIGLQEINKTNKKRPDGSPLS